MKYTWLLFDADGTLFDYDRAEATALRRTFEQTGHLLEPGYVETYRRINQQMWVEFEQGRLSQEKLRTRRFELLFESLGIATDPEVFSREYLRNLAEGTDLIEGAEEVIKALHGRAGLAIVTNGLKEVQGPRLARSAIADCISAMVISEEVGAAKPDQRFFEAAFQRIENPGKDNVLIVGDSLSSDIRGGNNYGIDTCWFNPMGKPPDLDVEIRYEISCLKELLDLVEVA